MLRNRAPRRGRHAPPLDVVHGVVVETWIVCEVYRGDLIESRDYAHEVDGVEVARTVLSRKDDDRRAWEEHWRIRGEFRRERQGREVVPA